MPCGGSSSHLCSPVLKSQLSWSGEEDSHSQTAQSCGCALLCQGIAETLTFHSSRAWLKMNLHAPPRRAHKHEANLISLYEFNVSSVDMIKSLARILAVAKVSVAEHPCGAGIVKLLLVARDKGWDV